MAEKIKSNGVEICKKGQYIEIYVPSFSTLIIVHQEEKEEFIEYLKYIYNKYKLDKFFYRREYPVQYREDKIYFGESSSVKNPKYGNYLEFNKIPIILDLLNCDGFEYSSIISIIKKIKKIRGVK